MKKRYSIEVWEFGWLICGNDGNGIPMDALKECAPLFPENSVMDAGISTSLRRRGINNSVCITTELGSKKWRHQIAESINHLDPQERWWVGCDTGSSSSAMFHVFCDERFKAASGLRGCGCIPLDSSDFGRCLNLMNQFPEWKNRLDEVSKEYPNTGWPEIIKSWDELENSSPENRNEMLRKISLAYR